MKTPPRAFPGSRVESVLNYRRSAASTGRLTGGPASPGCRQRVVVSHRAARPTHPLCLSNQAGVVTRHPVPGSSSVQGYKMPSTSICLAHPTPIPVQVTGHNLTTRQYVPKTLNHPPNRVKSGQRARARVEELLQSVDFVVLATARTDRYGRYLADVFYGIGQPDPAAVAAEGVYLNRQLLEEGLAGPYV